MDTYQVGTNSPNIVLNVDVDTIGMAATRANKRPSGAGGAGTAEAASVDATGDITNAPLGGAASLEGNTLTVATAIQLFGDAKERKAEFNRLTATYALSGGDEGVKVFPTPDLKLHNTDFSRATLVKSIKLIA